MLNRSIAVLLLFFMGLSSVLFFGIALIIWLGTVWFDRRLVLLHYFTCLWGSLYVWLFPFWRVRIKDRHKFRAGVTYLIVSNHQSQLDILISFCLFKHFKWVSKAEVFKVPFVGWNMFLNRYIRLRRGELSSVRKMYEDCIATLKSGSSVFIFPEGTRSQSVLPDAFKSGAFSIAKRAEVAILPIAISGTRDALPKMSLNFHGRQDLCLHVLDEIPVEESANWSVKDLAESARTRIVEALSRAE